MHSLGKKLLFINLLSLTGGFESIILGFDPMDVNTGKMTSPKVSVHPKQRMKEK